MLNIIQVVNHEVNVPPEGIIILMKGTKKGQTHNTYIQISSNIDSYKIFRYPRTIPE